MYEVSQPDKNLLKTIVIMATTVIRPQTPSKDFDDEIVSLTQRKNDVETQLHYYDNPGDGTPPNPSYASQDNTRPQVTLKATIHNVSGEQENYNLDSHGFQYLTHESTADFQNERKTEEQFYAEIERLWRDMQVPRFPKPMNYGTPIAFYRTGAHRVIIFDYLIRRVAADTRSIIDGNVTMR